MQPVCGVDQPFAHWLQRAPDHLGLQTQVPGTMHVPCRHPVEIITKEIHNKLVNEKIREK